MKHVYIDEYGHIKSFIHQLDPRIKITSFTFFILAVVFTNPAAFRAFGLYGMLIAILILVSRIPFNFVLKRSLVIIPFIMMIALFIPFIKAGEVAGGYCLGILKLTVTHERLMIFWNSFIKAYLSTLGMILLVNSSRFCDLLKALERLKCPRLFTMIFSFMYRYIFVVEDEWLKMQQAKEARSAGSSRWLRTKASANMLGLLFIRAYERGEDAYLAMCSRGFDGRIRTINDFELGIKDLYFLLIMVGLLTGIRILAS